jgi:hypothetical protein
MRIDEGLKGVRLPVAPEIGLRYNLARSPVGHPINGGRGAFARRLGNRGSWEYVGKGQGSFRREDDGSSPQEKVTYLNHGKIAYYSRITR